MNKLRTEITNSYSVQIYVVGDLNTIKQTCGEYCMKGLCVTVTSATFIYTQGE